MPETIVDFMHQAERTERAEAHWRMAVAILKSRREPVSIALDPELQYHMQAMELLHPYDETDRDFDERAVAELAREQEERDREDDRRAWEEQR